MSSVHMETGAVDQGMTGVEAAGAVFGDAWTSLRGQITANEGGIGGGLLARAFRAKYRPESVRTAADQLPVVYRDSAAVGRQCARDYAAADRAGAGAFGG